MQEVRADASVNSGNTLAAWAELLPAGEAVQMLASAQKAYEAALTQEEDAAVRHRTYTSVAALYCQQHTTPGEKDSAYFCTESCLQCVTKFQQRPCHKVVPAFACTG